MIGSLIGALRVTLGLDSAKFSRGARGVRSDLATMRRQFNVVAGVAAAMGAAVFSAARKGALGIDDAVKAARRLDASVGGFRAVQLAAQEAGVPLSALTNDLQSVGREIASIGKSGNAARALEELGLSVADLGGLDIDERVALIADRVKGLGLDAGQVTALLRDLGVRNRETALLFLQGGDAVRAARADIEDYGLAINEVDSKKIEVANDAIGRLGYAGQLLAERLALAVVPALGRMAEAMTDSLREGGLLRSVIDGLVGNLDRLSVYAAVAVAAFGGRYVVAMVAARVATFSLAASMVTLRRALIKTGIGALIVGAGELVLRFGRLRSAAGGTSEAFGLMSDVAVEVFQRINYASQALWLRMRSNWEGIKATVFEVLQSAVDAHFDFAATVGGVVRGVVEGFKAGFGVLPQALAAIMVNVSNAIIDKVNGLFTSFTSGLDSFIAKINDTLGTSLSGIGGGRLFERIGGGEAGSQASGVSVGEAFADGFRGAVEGVSLGNTPDLFGSLAEEMRGNERVLDGVAGVFWEGASSPLKSLEALRAVLREVRDDVVEVTPSVEVMNETLDEVGGGSGGGGSAGRAAAGLSSVGSAAEGLQQRIGRVRDMFRDTFESIIDKSKSVKGAIGSLLGEFAKLTRQKAFNSLFDGAVAKGGLFGSIVGALAGSIPANANGTNDFAGGLTSIHERGGEIVNLPSGSQIIPHDVSMRMAGPTGGDRSINININLDGANGDEAVRSMVADGVREGMQQVYRELPERIADANLDPRKRYS